MYNIEEFDKQKSKVMNYILYKKRTEQETRKKFQDIIDKDMLDDIIDYVKEAGYLSDVQYIEKAVLEFKNLKNLSIKEIEYKLMSKGLSRNDIENYIDDNFDELTEYEINSAYNLILKKQDKDEQEIIRYLSQKGFELDNIKKAIERV